MNDKQTPIENMLKAHKPQADSKFQHNLEQQLMARLHEKYGTQEEEDTVMMMKRKRNARSRLPLTLAAAVLAILLVGGLVVFLRMPPTSDAMPAAQSNPNQFELTATQLIVLATQDAALEQVTPTPVPDSFELTGTALIREVTEIASGTLSSQAVAPETVNMIVALNTINAGDIITEDSVTVIAVEADTIWQVAANTGGTWYYSDMNEVLGRTANTTIAPFEPITDQNTVDATTEITPTEDESGIPIIIAAQDIAIGETINATMVHQVFYPRSVASYVLRQNGDWGGFFGNIENVVGKQAITPIRALSPIHANAIAIPQGVVPQAAGSYILPQGRVAIAIPFELAESIATSPIHAGDTVTIVANVQTANLQGNYPDTLAEYADSNLDTQQITVTDDAIVAYIGNVPEFGEDIITLAMTHNEALVLNWLLEVAAPITFTSIVSAEKVTVAIPSELIATASMQYRIASADTLRISATVETDDLQRDYPTTLAQYAVSTSETVQIEVTSNALIIDMQNFTVAVTPEEAAVLSWLIESETPIVLEHASLESDGRVVPYYLPPEQFIGNYDALPESGNVRMVVFFYADDSDNMSVLAFDAFVNVDTYTHLLADVTYVDMLETLRLHGIYYTYTMLPLNGNATQTVSSTDDEVVIVPTFENAIGGLYAPPVTGLRARIVIMLPNYHETLPGIDVITQSGMSFIVLEGSVPADVLQVTEYGDYPQLALSPQDAAIFSILDEYSVEYKYAVIWYPQ